MLFRSVRCKYLVGADGGNSLVAEHAGLPFEGKMGVGGSMNILFRADLSRFVAHRPSALASVNKVLVMAGGQAKAFGPRDEILAKVTQPSPSAPPLAVVAAGAIRP